MHEFSIAQKIVRVVCDLVEEPQRVRLVAVRVGVMSGIVSDALSFGFEAAKQATPLIGSSLMVSVQQRQLLCATCGHAFASYSAWAACEVCGSPDVTASGGDDLNIDYVEVDDCAIGHKSNGQ